MRTPSLSPRCSRGLVLLALATGAVLGSPAGPASAAPALPHHAQRHPDAVVQGRPAPARVVAPSATTVVGSALTRGQVLGPGQSLQSPNGRFSLVLGTDGTLRRQVAANRLSGPTARDLLDVDPVPGAFLALQGDGNLVLYAPTGRVLYTFDSIGVGQVLQVQDDGNVVFYGPRATVLYDDASVNSYYLLPGEVLLPGDRLSDPDNGSVLYMQGDGNLVLYAGGRAVFNSGTSGNPGAATVLQGDGNLVVYSADPARALFNTGTQTATGTTLGLELYGDEFGIYRQEGDDEAVAVYGAKWASDTVLPGELLVPGDRRTSLGGVCTLVLQLDGNLVDYCGGQAVFSSGTSGDAFATMSDDGEFVVLTDDRVFSTRTHVPGSRLTVQGDRNVVVYTPQGRAVFSTRR